MDSIGGFHQEVIEARERKGKNLPIKQAVNIYPLKPGGASFRTHKLVQVSSSKMAYQPSIFAIVFCSLFLFIGIGLLSYNAYLITNKDAIISSNFSVISIIAGVIFSIIGGVFLFSIITPRVFDKRINLYYKSFSYSLRYMGTSKKAHKLSSIIALQIIGEHVNSGDNPYKSFELNIVLNDASRKNVVDHGNLKSIVSDAKILSEFLNIPIWHATSHVETD
ncbi:hypothetical protein [Winogradskyella haliclonae]|uniref:Uncharacterized protein n=1 Tax=Winogradskyella haliclonae TaxID=2048558 RepID=A0ABQ2C031_9FLAO|nr:hypothetical protein [Winogradskyella haliclonae]GGI57403.1 hypothetical protein GCM10011444_17120 [Winogradskyella haliclonae]